jgi:hypothetical protein
MVVAVIALIAALTGTAFAALGKNTVGSRQLKKKAVTTGKIANNAVNGAKVANGSLTGADINLGALGTVPAAQHADSAGEAAAVSGHSAACPGGTTLIRGVCFDSSPGPVLPNLEEASNSCAAKGGFLPTAMELFSVRSVINLGSGAFTDTYYYDATAGSNPSTVVVDGGGTFTQQPVTAAAVAVCAYPLVR